MGLMKRLKDWYHQRFSSPKQLMQEKRDTLSAADAMNLLAVVQQEHPEGTRLEQVMLAAERAGIAIPSFVALLPGERRGILSRLHRDSQSYEPLERIVRDSVELYNNAVSRYRRGDRRALVTRYQTGAAALGISVEVYMDALREHVASSALRYENGDRVQGYAKPAPVPLARFDRRLLKYDDFAQEVAQLYAGEQNLRVSDIASQLTEKYGMRISASHVSRIARKELQKRFGAVANRKEAQALYAQAADEELSSVRRLVSPVHKVVAANEADSVKKATVEAGRENSASRSGAQKHYAVQEQKEMIEQPPCCGLFDPSFEKAVVDAYLHDKRGWRRVVRDLNQRYNLDFKPRFLDTLARSHLLYHIGYTANRREAQRRVRSLSPARQGG